MAYQRKTKDVNISPKLQQILTQISNKSDIAKQLLRTKLSKDDLVEDPIDYLSVSKTDPSKISYLQSAKIQKAKLPEDASIEEYWNLKGRDQAKPAAAIKKFLKNTTEKELDLFTSLYKAATAKKDFVFEIVTGEDIKKYYHEDSYKPMSSGSLSASCMCYDRCRDYFEIYINNPKNCQMLIMLDEEGLLIGRSLLWNAVDIEKGTSKKVMDRIYSINDEKIHHFKEWADDNGYIARRDQKWSNCMYFESFGNVFKCKLSVKIKKESYSLYPYVDTFKFWDEKNGILSNFLPVDNGYLRVLIGNGGGVATSEALELDMLTDSYEHREKMVTLDYPVNGIYYKTQIDNLNYSSCMNKYMMKEHSVYDHDINDHYFIGEWASMNDKLALEERRQSYCGNNKNRGYAKEPADTLTFAEYTRLGCN